MSPDIKPNILQTNPGNEVVEIDSDILVRFLTNVFKIDARHFTPENASFAKFHIDLRGESPSVFVEAPHESGVVFRLELYRGRLLDPEAGIATYLDIEAKSQKEDEHSISESNQIVSGTYPLSISEIFTQSDGRYGKAIYFKSKRGGVVLTHEGNIKFHPSILL